MAHQSNPQTAMADAEAPTVTNPKRHASCDECRARKVKCSGENEGCSRCSREQIPCHYSAQMPMGRPRKRRRNEGSSTLEENAIETIDEEAMQIYQPTANISFDDILPESYPIEPSSDNNNGNNNDPPIPFLDPLLDDPAPTQNFHIPESSAIPPPPSQTTPTPEVQPHPTTTTTTTTNACACLDSLYLTLSSLQPYAAPTSSLIFPLPLSPMRQAINTGYTVLHCRYCASVFAAGLQNLMLLGTLLQLLAVSYSNLLDSIDDEAARLRASGVKKKFRMGDTSAETSSMHTGTLDCPMGFEVEMTADEWCSMARKVTVDELRGKDGKGGLVGLLNSMEERQRERHRRAEAMRFEERDHDCRLLMKVAQPKGEYSCLRILDHSRRIIESVHVG